MKLAVIGDPIDHSRSPELFTRLFARAGVEGSYERVRVPPTEIDAFLSEVRAGRFDGLSVTLPLKRVVADLVDELTPLAQRVQAVNCVYRVGDRLIGDNTDVAGVRGALRFLAPELRLDGCRALILGGSGAARGAAFALEGSELTFANRTLDRARRLAETLPRARAMHLDAARPDGFDLIINATSVGLTDDVELLPGARFSTSQVVLDMVYTPRETPLLQRALSAGARAVDGLWMLVFQAIAQSRNFGLPGLDAAAALDLYRDVTRDDPSESRDRAIIAAGRRRIDEIDRALLATLAERIRVAHEIGPAKRALGLPVVRPERERELRAKHEAWALEEGLDPDYARKLFDLVLARSRAEQAHTEEDAE